MWKPDETEADRIWREKLEACGSFQEAIIFLIVMGALQAAILIVG
jgi:hypothetical protein